MRKSELASRISKKTGMSMKDAVIAIEATFEVIASALIEGDEVSIANFGTLKTDSKAMPVFKPAKPLLRETKNRLKE